MSSKPPGAVLALAGSVPWRSIALDLLVVGAWVAVATVAFRLVDLPTWLYYVVAFGGVVAYSLLAPRW